MARICALNIIANKGHLPIPVLPLKLICYSSISHEDITIFLHFQSFSCFFFCFLRGILIDVEVCLKLKGEDTLKLKKSQSDKICWSWGQVVLLKKTNRIYYNCVRPMVTARFLLHCRCRFSRSN